jgi:hypothetical protein
MADAGKGESAFSKTVVGNGGASGRGKELKPIDGALIRTSASMPDFKPQDARPSLSKSETGGALPKAGSESWKQRQPPPKLNRPLPKWYKQHRKQKRKMLPPSVRASKSLGVEIALTKDQVKAAFRMDHTNVPARVKTEQALQAEQERVEMSENARGKNEVKAFPNGLRESKLRRTRKLAEQKSLLQEELEIYGEEEELVQEMAEIDQALSGCVNSATEGADEYGWGDEGWEEALLGGETDDLWGDEEDFEGEGSEDEEESLIRNKRMMDKDYLHIDQSALPLTQFDSEVYETHTPEEWVATGSAAMTPHWHGDMGWVWAQCEVLGYDDQNQKYLINFVDFPMPVPKPITRIHLRFDLENPQVFRKRVFAAHEARELAKSTIRFEHYLKNRGTEDVKPMQPSTLKNIHAKVEGGIPERYRVIKLANKDEVSALCRQLAPVLRTLTTRSCTHAVPALALHCTH